jgi:antitoxin Phd
MKETKNKAQRAKWQLREAKAKFDEVFRRALTEGPQVISRRGKEKVVVISSESYEELVRRSRQPKSLWEFFRESPLVGVELKLERKKDRSREIDLA